MHPSGTDTEANQGEHHKIVPGKSIGPFRLGMTRAEIEALNAGTMKRHKDGQGAYFPLVEVSLQVLDRASYPRPGVNVYYDAADRCCKLEALFGYKPTPPIFTLAGHIVNGMKEQEAAAILVSMGAFVSYSYASVHAPSAGIRAIKWEASDEHIMAIVVTPPK